MKISVLELLAFSVWTSISLSFQPTPAISSDFPLNSQTGTRLKPSKSFDIEKTSLNIRQIDATAGLCQNISDKHPRSQKAKNAISNTSKLPYFNWKSDVGILGFKFKIKGHGFPEVETIFSGTPSQKAQLQIGDKIKFVDDVPTGQMTTPEVTGLLVGAPGTRVILTIDRNGAVLKKNMIRMHSKVFAQSNPKIFRMYIKSVQ